MRNALTTMVGMAFLLTVACSSTPPNGDGGSNGTGGGSTGTLLPPGAVCGGNGQCESNICGITGTGHCCLAECHTGSASETCAIPSDCDDMGKCVYPVMGTNCGTTCAGDMRTTNTCDGAGGCSNPKTTLCPGDFGCGATDCNTSCSADAGGCSINHFCNNGACAQTIDFGPCNGDSAECSSGLCAPNGYCCRQKCPGNAKFPECSIMACTADAGGSCVYPPAGNICDTADESCTGSTLNAGQCDGMGTCNPGSSACPNNYSCDLENHACVGACAGDVNCAHGYYCVTKSGANLGKCLPQIADGGCTDDDQCLSEICGVPGGNGGHCCAAACVTGDKICGATDCDNLTELCDYPKAGTTCTALAPTGMVALSCTNGVQTNPTICDGLGTCPAPTPALTNCPPFTCNGTGAGAACYTTCKDNTVCIAGDFCDTTAGSCCAPITGTISVDAVIGKDAACCGIGANQACQTIGYAMKLIDAAQAKNVVILAAVAGSGGDWTVPGEVYPIVLGWGAELNGAGIAFEDPNSVGGLGVVGKAIFDVKKYSANDTVGYASIFGTTANQLIVGMNSKINTQSKDTTGILVEAGNTLYLAGATVNGNSNPPTAAITVQAGATLILGTDQPPGANIGTVTIGTKGNLNGGNGIVCGAAGATSSCIVTDNFSPDAGISMSSLVIENQGSYDIDAEDMASITLGANPVIGVAPKKAGFGQCLTKNDGSGLGLNLAAVLLRGSATMTLDNGTVQCISAPGFRLMASASATPPSLTMDTTTIQHTELAISASDGTATVTGSTLQFNYTGVEQTTDAAGNAGTVDLSGGGNTVICSSAKESVVPLQQTPGVSVLNTTSSTLKASMTAWDTSGPDLFSCNAALNMCTCQSGGGCTDTAGMDGMDAVYTGTGTIITTGNTLASDNNCQ